jgi:hypothetical protein
MKNALADHTAGRSVNEFPHSTKNKTANIRIISAHVQPYLAKT